MRIKNLLSIIILISAFSISIEILSNIEAEKVNAKEISTAKSIKSEDYMRKSENIVFLGDSITDWYPLEEIYGDLPIVNSGVAGYETHDILERLDDMVYKYNPTKVFILIGTNDLKYKDEDENEEEIAQNIEKIIKNIQKNRSNAKIYVQSIYPVNKEIKNDYTEERNNDEIIEVNKMIKEYCEENNVNYIDMFNALADDNGNFSEDYTKDGLHPTDLGYAKITVELLKYIYE